MWETMIDVLTYVGVVIVGFLVWAALSPFEVMGWWAGWFGEKIYDGGVNQTAGRRDTTHKPDCYMIFMSGVGRATGETLSFREQEFLRRLSDAMPRMEIVDDLFLYSVNNMPLTGQPFFARMWRWALRRKLNGPILAGYLINVRNIWQLLISADHRYGPMFNQAVAEVVIHGLQRYGYDPTDPRPIFLLGYSGAGQLAIGPVTYLKEWLCVPVYTISLGGVFASAPGMEDADRIYHLLGRQDRAPRWAMIAPGRWPFMVSSHWNRARRQGKFVAVDMGDMGHTGRGGYLDHKSTLPDGTLYIDRTVTTIVDIVRRHVATPSRLPDPHLPAPRPHPVAAEAAEVIEVAEAAA